VATPIKGLPGVAELWRRDWAFPQKILGRGGGLCPTKCLP